MGSDGIAIPLLEWLAAQPGVSFSAVFTQPDKATGRGMRTVPNAIKSWAQQRDIAVLQPQRCAAAEASFIRESGIELVIVMAYGQILKPDLLEAPRLGVVNFHASLLPRLRGASPIATAMALGLAESGVSLMRIIPQLDAGPVADAERVAIGPADSAATLYENIAAACVPLLARNFQALTDGSIHFQAQDPAAVSYCRILEKSDAHLNFNAPATELANRIRAFQPWPGASFPHGSISIKVQAAHAEEAAHNAAPGTVISSSGQLRIACASGVLVLQTLQRPGGRPLPVADFLRGYPIAEGSPLESLPMRPLESSRPFPYRRRSLPPT